MGIKNFADDTTFDIFNGLETDAARRIPKDVWPAAKRRLDALNAAKNKLQLASIRGNHFESLAANRPGYFSMRINKIYRLIFMFENGDAYYVGIENYHGRKTS